MLKVGLNQNQANYQNKKQDVAFGASKNKVGRLVAKALKDSDGTPIGINRQFYKTIYPKIVYKEMAHGNFIEVYTTAAHINDIGEKIQKKGNLKLGNCLISYSGKIKGHINHIISIIESDLKDMVPVQKGLLKGYNLFLKRPLPNSMKEKII